MDKPLHVQVAEALGWTDPHHEGVPTSKRWVARDPEAEPQCPCRGSHCYPAVPRYDTDWSATGPLIEKYGINLQCESRGWVGVTSWHACQDEHAIDSHYGHKEDGDTPLIAACRYILALSASGKLRDATEEGKPGTHGGGNP